MYIEKVHCPQDIKQLSIKELCSLANEIRTFLINSVSRTGGHVGVNCGVVELTIALHYVFDSPADLFNWDVGHQSYVHKILTGRKSLIEEMRQDGGSPGFPCKQESAHDIVDVSHGGTSLSLAMGQAVANKILPKKGLPIAIIGDSALGEGMAYEALNDIGYEGLPMLIILNDNGWGITSNNTALSNYFARFKVDQNNITETFFNTFGLEYQGPFDGHKIENLISVFEQNRSPKSPVVLHIKTIKGKGLPAYAKTDVCKYHFSFPFNIETGKPINEIEGTDNKIFYKPISPFNASLIGKKIQALAETDKKITVITPATIGAAEIMGVFNTVPDKAFDVGMAEQHALTLAVGQALQGLKPIVCYQSTFFQRAFDQLIHDVCINKAPVMIILARSGLAGLDHATHHAQFDLSYLLAIPNLEVFFPTDHIEFNQILELKMQTGLTNPTVMLFPYGTIEMLEPNHDERLLLQDKSSLDKEGILLTTAGCLKLAFDVYRKLKDQQKHWSIENICSLKPLDQIQIHRILSDYERIVIIEENVGHGGLSALIMEFSADNQYKPDILRINLGDKFIDHGTRNYLYQQIGIDSSSIQNKINTRWPD